MFIPICHMNQGASRVGQNKDTQGKLLHQIHHMFARRVLAAMPQKRKKTP
jgi:hypothetical protein